MQPYLAIDGDRTIVGYLDSDAFIHVFFQEGPVYEYLATHVGHERLVTMRQLARLGEGLARYLAEHVPANLGRRIR